MKNLIKITTVLIFALGSVASAQQLPQFTQYMYNTISVNPAYAGSRETLNVTALHRNQWAGLEGNPTTSTLSVHTPLRNDRIGLGISYIGDQLGFEKTNYVYGDFSYSVPVSKEIKLSLGLKAGFTNYRLDNPDFNDPFFNTNFNSWNPNFGAGAFIGSNRWSNCRSSDPATAGQGCEPLQKTGRRLSGLHRMQMVFSGWPGRVGTASRPPRHLRTSRGTFVFGVKRLCQTQWWTR